MKSPNDNDPLDFERTVDASGKEKEGSRFCPGDMLGQYRIIRLLGRGGMGEVYEVEHTTLGLHYALKLLPPDLMSRPGALERFRREARVMANLKHPYIVQVDDFGETEGQYWLRMELMEGIDAAVTGSRGDAGRMMVSLADLAEAGGGKIEQSLLADILRQVIVGLEYAHKHGAVHRDLKPSNILLEDDDEGNLRVKIADFGLVRLVGEEWVMSRAEESVRLSMSMGEKATIGGKKEGTSTRALLGTYEYMSPEQKRGEEADARSDIYSLGLMTFKMLTGRDLGLKMPSQIEGELVKGWDGLVAEALEQSQDDRLNSCDEFSYLLVGVEEQIKANEHELEEEERRKREEEKERRIAEEESREREAEEKRR